MGEKPKSWSKSLITGRDSRIEHALDNEMGACMDIFISGACVD